MQRLYMRHSQGFWNRVLHLFQPSKQSTQYEILWLLFHSTFRALLCALHTHKRTQTWHRKQISQFHCYGVFTFSHVLRAAPHINKLNNIHICKQQIDRPTDDQPNETTNQMKESTTPNKLSKEFVLGLNSRRSLS